MNILEKIAAYKKEELLVRKMMVPVDQVINSIHFEKACISLKDSLSAENATGLIPEFKRRSPYTGILNNDADAGKVTKDFTRSGASALSVITDNHFFGGNTEDLVKARENHIPVIRREFIIDPYQVLTTKAMGADAIILIAAILTKEDVKSFADSARRLGLQVILEIHENSELGHISEDIDIICINNRNLKTFNADTGKIKKLNKQLPAGIMKITSGGIISAEEVERFKQEGFQGFIMGEIFMKEKDPGFAFGTFVKTLK